MNNSDIPDDDRVTWENFLKNPDQYQQVKQIQKQNNNIIQIDLHNMSIKQADKLIDKTIVYARNHNLDTISIITGIGAKHINNTKSFGTLYTEIPRRLELLKEQAKIIKYHRNKNNPGEIIVKLDLKP